MPLTPNNGDGRENVGKISSANTLNKQQRYIAKLKQLSKNLSSDHEVTPTSSPDRSNESSTKEISPVLINQTDSKTKQEEKQIRSLNKLKALVNKLESESPTTTKSLPSTHYMTHYVSPDAKSSTPPKDKRILNDKRSVFDVRALLRCCGEMDVEDLFSEDDDIDRLLNQKCDDTALLDDWSLDVSSADSGLLKRDLDTTNATDITEQSEFFLGEPCEI